MLKNPNERADAVTLRELFSSTIVEHNPEIAMGMNKNNLSGSKQNFMAILQRKTMKESTERPESIEEIANKHKADLLYNLGVTQENLKNYALALDYHQKCLHIRRNMYPDELFKTADHIDIADSLKSIGSLFDKLDQPKKCIECMLKSYEIKHRIYLKPHTDLIDCLNRYYRFTILASLVILFLWIIEYFKYWTILRKAWKL